MNLRLFIALEFPVEVQQKIYDSLEPIRQATNEFRWVKRENIHLTLRFLGGIDEALVSKIHTVLRRQSRVQAPFELIVGGLDAFPNLTKPRTLWVSAADEGNYCRELKNEIDRLLLEVGFEKETQKFIPHVTVGRLKDGRRPALEADRFKGGAVSEPSGAEGRPVDLSDMQNNRVFQQLRQEVGIDRFTLIQSNLELAGPVYTKLFDIPLTAPSPA